MITQAQADSFNQKIAELTKLLQLTSIADKVPLVTQFTIQTFPVLPQEVSSLNDMFPLPDESTLRGIKRDLGAIIEMPEPWQILFRIVDIYLLWLQFNKDNLDNLRLRISNVFLLIEQLYFSTISNKRFAIFFLFHYLSYLNQNYSEQEISKIDATPTPIGMSGSPSRSRPVAVEEFLDYKYGVLIKKIPAIKLISMVIYENSSLQLITLIPIEKHPNTCGFNVKEHLWATTLREFEGGGEDFYFNNRVLPSLLISRMQYGYRASKLYGITAFIDALRQNGIVNTTLQNFLAEQCHQGGILKASSFLACYAIFQNQLTSSIAPKIAVTECDKILQVNSEPGNSNNLNISLTIFLVIYDMSEQEPRIVDKEQQCTKLFINYNVTTETAGQYLTYELLAMPGTKVAFKNLVFYFEGKHADYLEQMLPEAMAFTEAQQQDSQSLPGSSATFMGVTRTTRSVSVPSSPRRFLPRISWPWSLQKVPAAAAIPEADAAAAAVFPATDTPPNSPPHRPRESSPTPDSGNHSLTDSTALDDI